MSEFIEKSKHPEGTAAVEHHFAGGNVGRKPGTDPQLKAPPYGTAAWNSHELDGIFEEGDAGKGVNYRNPADAGHTVTERPFQGSADGLPGSSKKLWNK
jgi:hypothetical protein